jgi:lysine 6-dehydrogenase
VTFELLDYFDPAHGISAMMRTTGYSLSLTALMQSDGTIAARGVHTPDEAVPFRSYVDGLARFGVRIEDRS